MEEKVNAVIIDGDGSVFCRRAECPVEHWYDNSCDGCPLDKLFNVAMHYGIDAQIALNKKRKEQENGKAKSN